MLWAQLNMIGRFPWWEMVKVFMENSVGKLAFSSFFTSNKNGILQLKVTFMNILEDSEQHRFFLFFPPCCCSKRSETSIKAGFGYYELFLILWSNFLTQSEKLLGEMVKDGNRWWKMVNIFMENRSRYYNFLPWTQWTPPQHYNRILSHFMTCFNQHSL